MFVHTHANFGIEKRIIWMNRCFIKIQNTMRKAGSMYFNHSMQCSDRNSNLNLQNWNNTVFSIKKSWNRKPPKEISHHHTKKIYFENSLCCWNLKIIYITKPWFCLSYAGTEPTNTAAVQNVLHCIWCDVFWGAQWETPKVSSLSNPPLFFCLAIVKISPLFLFSPGIVNSYKRNPASAVKLKEEMKSHATNPQRSSRCYYHSNNIQL